MFLKFASRMKVPRYDQLRIKNTTIADSAMYTYKVYYGESAAFDGGVILSVKDSSGIEERSIQTVHLDSTTSELPLVTELPVTHNGILYCMLLWFLYIHFVVVLVVVLCE